MIARRDQFNDDQIQPSRLTRIITKLCSSLVAIARRGGAFGAVHRLVDFPCRGDGTHRQQIQVIHDKPRRFITDGHLKTAGIFIVELLMHTVRT